MRKGQDNFEAARAFFRDGIFQFMSYPIGETGWNMLRYPGALCIEREDNGRFEGGFLNFNLG